MRILITGAGGMLGTDVVGAVAAAGHDPVAFRRAELDITDMTGVAAKLQALRPDAVINCAAYTDVDGAEADEAAATAVNGLAPGSLAAAAVALGARTIHVSTDYVFDGTKGEPYVESDHTAPLGAYGRSKLAGEIAIARAASGAHTIVRSSWLFGAAGACFPKTILRLAAEREELKVVDDQIGCPTFTGHLASALVALAVGDPVPGIVHVAGEGACSWYEFAREIVAAAGSGCEVRPCTTAEFPRPAPRPAYSVLGTERGSEVPRLDSWRAGLAEFLTTTTGVPR
jgi:dTDP-4-dehydrorhamnose reductase